MPFGFYVEAEYESGYVHREDDQDHSPYVRHKNIFNDILEKRPEAAHGPMIRFSIVTPNLTHHVDWTRVPDNARPVRYINFENDYDVDNQLLETRIMEIGFGFQWTDEAEINHKEIIKL